MIRKAVVVVLMLGAVAVIVGWVLSERLFIGADCLCLSNLSTGVGWHLQLDPDCPWRLCVSGRGGNLHLDYIEHGRGFRYWRYEFVGVHTRRTDMRMSQRLRNLLLDDCDCDAYFRYSPPSVATVRLPFLYLFLAFVVYPTIAFIRGPLRRWRRRKRGECLNCAYDLTGNVTGVCSECGTAV